MSVRLVCDSCADQWHPRCLRPPICDDNLPKGFWLCPRCTRGECARALAWSLDGCPLCDEAPRTAGARVAAERARGPWRIVADDELDSFEAAGAACPATDAGGAVRFAAGGGGGASAHAALIARTNAGVDQFNCQLLGSAKHAELALDASALDAICARARTLGGLNVVSCCDGKGTLLGILLRRRVPVRAFVSVEHDPNAQRVCRANYTGLLGAGTLSFIDELRDLSPKRLRQLGAWPPHLVFGSTPCNDLTSIRRGREALPGGGTGAPGGAVALLFAAKLDELRAAKGGWGPAYAYARPPAAGSVAAGGGGPSIAVASGQQAACSGGGPPDRHPNARFVVVFENVSSMLPEARAVIVAALRLPAFDSDAAVWEAAHRRRLFVSNMALSHVPADTADRCLQDVLVPPAFALTTKAACIRSNGSQGSEARAGTAQEVGRRLKNPNLVLCSPFVTDVRGLLVQELAGALGLPPSEVDAATGGEAAKRGLLGRGLADGQAAHVLHELIRRMSAPPLTQLQAA